MISLQLAWISLTMPSTMLSMPEPENKVVKVELAKEGIHLQKKTVLWRFSRFFFLGEITNTGYIRKWKKLNLDIDSLVLKLS